MKKSGTAETQLRFRLFEATKRWKRFFVVILIILLSKGV